MRKLLPLCVLVGLIACSDIKKSEVVAESPTLALRLETTAPTAEALMAWMCDALGGVDCGAVPERLGFAITAVCDVGNPNAFPIEIDGLHVTASVDGALEVMGSGPALTLPERALTECHAALEECVVTEDAQFCCKSPAICKPLKDCFGRVTSEGSRCLVCPTHVEVRVPLAFEAGALTTLLTPFFRADPAARPRLTLEATATGRASAAEGVEAALEAQADAVWE